MALPSDFQALMDPRDLQQDKRWTTFIHSRSAAYKRRFFVCGLPQAAQALGFSSPREIWNALAALAAQKDFPDHSRRPIADPIVRALAASVPPRWIAAIPDVNDRGNAPAYTTYWREFSLDQLIFAWQASEQTLPKALLAIVALAVAAEQEGKTLDALAETAPVICPSVFWLVDYTASIHDRIVARDLATQREAYAACGLDFDLGANRRSDALKQAADARATLTFATATRLKPWLAEQGIVCGPIRVHPDAARISAADEVFADIDIAFDLL